MRIDPETCRDPDLLATEVRRLRTVVASEPTLTDAEREAIEWYANFPDGIHAATLRGLLERLR